MDWTEEEQAMMQRALTLAERGRGYVEPNPMVGCVLVRDGRIIGEGRHERFGGPHAEVNAIRAAGDVGAEGATCYVTLEPCAWFGKTPACAPFLIRCGVREVVIAAADPDPTTGGKGGRMLREHGVRVRVGLCRDEAVLQNAAFFKRMREGRPLVTAKWAMTLDGRIAAPDGSSKWISSRESRRLVHEVRGRMDAILIGIGTALADDPELTCRNAEVRRRASRIVLDSRARLPLDSRLVRTADDIPTLVVVGSQADGQAVRNLKDRSCEVLALPVSADGQPDPGALLDELGRRGMSNILVEGGSTVLSALYDHDLIDCVLAFVAPRLLGHAEALSPLTGTAGKTMAALRPLHHSELRSLGGDAVIAGWLRDPPAWGGDKKVW